MIRPILTLCDLDETYCGRLYEYLKENLKLSFEIEAFTTIDILLDFAKQNETNLLLASETVFSEMKKSGDMRRFKNILILDEDSTCLREDESFYGETYVEHTTKYQPAGRIVNTIVDFCARKADCFEGLGTGYTSDQGKVIGLYSPVSKCGQTSLALKIGEQLSKHGRTVLLSFDSFSYLPKVLELDSEGSLTDLIYYAESDSSKFCIYLEKIKNTRGSLDIIPPARTAMHLKEIDHDSLKRLIDLLIHESGYEYVVLDLTEYPEGFFDILRLCNKIFTIAKQTGLDQYKIEAYEDVLRKNGYEDIIANTVKISIPDLKAQNALSKFATDILCKEDIINAFAS